MISTIGSLVQETSKRSRWLIAASIYIIACSCTSALMGIVLGLLGYFLQTISGDSHNRLAIFTIGSLIVAGVVIAYAFSDIGAVKLPRPRLRHAVPLVWWRLWQPYGAALAYGLSLGVGVMTHIHFGAFYALCLWCIVKGNIGYAALLMGTYGCVRALTLLPASLGVYYGQTDSSHKLNCLVSSLGTAKLIVAVVSVVFGVQIVVVTFF